MPSLNFFLAAGFLDGFFASGFFAFAAGFLDADFFGAVAMVRSLRATLRSPTLQRRAEAGQDGRYRGRRADR